MPFAHPLLSSGPRHDRRRLPSPALPRDLEANTQLQIALAERGYSFGRTILNYPGKKLTYDLVPPNELVHVEIPFAVPNDVLTWTTRPPLSDGWYGDNKRVEPANTTLERAILNLYRRYFRVCARSYVEFTEEAARWLPAEKRNRETLEFYQVGCQYKYLKARGGKRSRVAPLGPRTAGMIFRTDEIWPGGPGLVCAWGVNAIATLGLCRLIRFRHADLLDRRGLTMVEITTTPTPERPLTYDWVMDWDVTEIFSTQDELPPRPDETNYAISL